MRHSPYCTDDIPPQAAIKSPRSISFKSTVQGEWSDTTKSMSRDLRACHKHSFREGERERENEDQLLGTYNTRKLSSSKPNQLTSPGPGQSSILPAVSHNQDDIHRTMIKKISNNKTKHRNRLKSTNHNPHKVNICSLRDPLR